MYAIFEKGGKQYRAEEGGRVLIDLLDAEPGSEIKFDNVVLLSGDKGVTIGNPTVKGAAVVAVVEGDVKDKKVVGRHRTQRNRTQTKTGHRQKYTEILIKKIKG